MNPHMTEIKAPVIKSVTAIGAAVGANTEAAGNAAVSVAQAIAPTADPTWYWLIMSMPWDKIASFLAAVYTLIWRSWLRQIAVSRGWWTPGEPLLTRSQWSELSKDE
jgi:hypothetical protein